MRRTISLFAAIVLLLTCGFGQAFADVMINNQINNQIKNGESNTVIIGSEPRQNNGLQMILATGDQHSITMPNTYSYITPVAMYVDAPGDHSIYVYKDLKLDKEKIMPFAFEGMRVMAVAEQQLADKTNVTCIVYRDENYHLHAGWVHSQYLTSWFPGEMESIGTMSPGTVYTTDDPVLSWATNYFVNTKLKYTLLGSPIPACTQFMLNYQVTARGGARTEEVLGPRSVYVNDGSGWTEVGQFNYPKIQSVLVTVNLPEPMDLLAVAVIPYCSKPEVFTYRQTVQDVLTADANRVSGGTAWYQGSGSSGVIWNSQPNTVIVTQPSVRSITRGSIVTYGAYEQDNYSMGSREPIEWIVLDAQEERLLLISRYALDCLSYCSRQESVAWETSNIRSWLNDQFLNAAFTPEEQRGILLTEVDNSRSQGYIHYEGDGGNNTWDQVFLLSYTEAWKYFYQSSDRACKPTKTAVKRGAFESSISGNCPWWLRSPGYTTDYVAVVDVDGNRGGNVKYGATGIRPAMWVDRSAVTSLGYIRYSK